MADARRFLIKICGVTTPEDAAAAAAAGADAIGVNFWPGSKRFVGGLDAAGALLAAVPAGVLRVGVFVNAPADEVARTVAHLGLDRAQLHGAERAADYATLARDTLIRAVRVRDQASFIEGTDWHAGLWLYDAHAAGFGGSGQVAPWPLVARAASRPFLLAGGLTADNVAQAIAITRPDGVDVASGVERGGDTGRWRKDPFKMQAFVRAARAAAAAL
jgi:phosphoribosylanthranilate isomerase